MHDLINSLVITQASAPQVIDTTPVATGNIDMQGAESLLIVAAIGDIEETLGPSARIDLKIEHAEDNDGSPAAYTACGLEDILGVETITDGIFASVNDDAKENKRHLVAYRGGRRFVRVTATPTGLTDGGAIALLAIKGNLAQRPQA